MSLLPQSGRHQVAPRNELENDFLNFWFSDFPLSRAEHRRVGREERADLSERSEFPRAPSDGATRRIKRDTGVFFWFVFFYAEENEQTNKKSYPGSLKPIRGLHLRWRV